MAHRLTRQAQFNDLPFVNFSGYPTFFLKGKNNFIEKGHFSGKIHEVVLIITIEKIFTCKSTLRIIEQS